MTWIVMVWLWKEDPSMLWPFNLLRDEQIRCARHLIEKKPGTKKIYSTEIDMDPQRSKKWSLKKTLPCLCGLRTLINFGYRIDSIVMYKRLVRKRGSWLLTFWVVVMFLKFTIFTSNSSRLFILLVYFFNWLVFSLVQETSGFFTKILVLETTKDAATKKPHNINFP